MASLLSKLLLVGAAASPAHAAIAAWWNGIAPQIILQNDTTNQIRYSACNSKGSPKYSSDDGRVFSLSWKPKAGTPLAGVGWGDTSSTTASLWYITEDNQIVNGYYSCNMTTGLFQTLGNWVVSDPDYSVHSNSGLAAVVLGATDGYRVYYHDSDGAINELKYYDKTWSYNALISHDINSLPALGVAFSGTSNITVASPRDAQTIGITRLNKDESWYRTTFPQPLKNNFTVADTNRSSIAVNKTAPANFTLPAWDGTTHSIGVTIDANFTRFLWYIGNDSSLHQVGNTNFTWTARANQSDTFWPQADTPNADLAAAYVFSSSVVRIYYMVKGQLADVTFQNGTWKAWSTVAAAPAVQTQGNATSTTSTDVPSADSGGLSTGAKAGIGVGVSLGAIAVSAIIAIVILAKKRKQQGFEAPPSGSVGEEGSTTLSPDTPAPSYGSPAFAPVSALPFEADDHKSTSSPAQHYAPYADEPKQVHQLDSTARAEMYVPQPLYELPSQTYSHELVAEPPRPRQ